MNGLTLRKMFSNSTTYLRISSTLVSNSVINKPNILLTNYSTHKDNSTNVADRINKLINGKKVVVFMKGIPDQPMCGFSNAVVQIFRMHGVDYDAHNILEDEELRSGIKEFSDWPTIPQIYINEEFVGGCDILLQMHQNGELIEELKTIGIRSALLDKNDNN